MMGGAEERMSGLLLGYDVGSSSIKAAALDAESGACLAAAASPERELAIDSPRPGWAEQDPAVWWEHLSRATRLLARQVALAGVQAVGISYQMHGLVCLDKAGRVLRPAIIWCDSRAVGVGERAFRELGQERCLERLLNSPGNFTASKLAWVRENEPAVFARVHQVLLPGDYIAFRLTGEARTTFSGLSEAILWDFLEGAVASFLLEHYGIPPAMLPPALPSFSNQGRLTGAAAAELGLPAGAPVSYRAGDQPNNALSLNVLEPGEIAATAGTSGVVYGVGDRATFDPASRVNSFVHVNHSPERPRIGTLLCVNGTAILNSWLRHNVLAGKGESLSYEEMNALAAEAPPGSDGLIILPFGNGAERTLENRNPGASIHGLSFTRHTRAHLLRAAQEGIVFALRQGLEIMAGMGLSPSRVRAGNANMFLSPLFAEAFATASGAAVELYNTDGAQGAARGAGIGAGLHTARSAFAGLDRVRVVEPSARLQGAYEEAYGRWQAALRGVLAG
jgi:xylulokinase